MRWINDETIEKKPYVILERFGEEKKLHELKGLIHRYFFHLSELKIDIKKKEQYVTFDFFFL